MRESIEAKGRRYLAEGRLVIRAVDAERIEAQARGTGNIYDLGYRGGWYCGRGVAIYSPCLRSWLRRQGRFNPNAGDPSWTVRRIAES